MTGEWRKLHNKELRDLYSSPSIIRNEEDENGGACSTDGGKKNACRLLVRMPEGKRPLGRPSRIRMDLGEVGWSDVDWIDLPQDKDMWRALVNAIMNLRVPQNAGKLSSGLTTGGISSSAQLHRVS
jgi:hypothetical protein